jgi:hypothetical protein
LPILSARSHLVGGRGVLPVPLDIMIIHLNQKFVNGFCEKILHKIIKFFVLVFVHIAEAVPMPTLLNF